MYELVIFLVVIGSIGVLALLIWINYLIAKEFERIAQEKGYFEKRYFWCVFFLGILGILMVIALPDKYARPDSNINPSSIKFENNELPEL